jgi:hypothetical protein
VLNTVLQGEIPTAWHEADPEADELAGMPGMAKMLFDHIRGLEQDQMDIHLMNAINARLYYNREPLQFQWESQVYSYFRPLNANIENGIQSVLDTLTSRLGTQQSKATIYTRGADFKTYLKGRLLDRYVWGQFMAQGIHTILRDMFLDAMIYGTGFMKIDVDWRAKDIRAEVVNPDEIIVDQRECVSGAKPFTMTHRRLVSKAWIKKAFAKGDDKQSVTDAVDRATGKDYQYTSYRTPAEDQTVVIETWKRPTLPGGNDGLHVIAIEGKVLFTEAWKRDEFPIVELRWAKAPGYYGRSLVSDLIGYQVRLDKLNEAIEWGQDVMCVPRVWLDQSQGIIDSRLDNRIGNIIRGRGEAPKPMVWNAFSPELYNERDRVRASMYEFAGVSTMSAQNKAPQGWRADSSEALREMTSHEDERFNDKAQALEEAQLNIAKHIIRCSKELYTRGSAPTVTYQFGNLVQQIAWEDVDLKADQYVMQISASSVLNLTPAARKDKLKSWKDEGLISPQRYMAWSGEPDLERVADLEAANHDFFEHQIDKMLDGKPATPDPNSSLSEGVVMVNNTYLHVCTLEDTPKNVKKMMQVWLLTAESILNQQPPPPPQLGVMGGSAVPFDPGMATMGGQPPMGMQNMNPQGGMMAGPPGMPPGPPPGMPQ